ncbi:Crp/Fnr family transcriptional regulator [Anaeromicropila populeti]|nr:Crp/Fnr family transcriptional regulator [Anaeromicropila populeti]
MKESRLFCSMTEEEIEKCLKCSGAMIKTYCSDEIVFHQFDAPERLFVLLEGSVTICQDTNFGKRNIMTQIQRKGDIFGEVYLFMEHKHYEVYGVVSEYARVLQIPKHFFYRSCSNNCRHHEKLIYNLISIMADKAYMLNRKLQLMSCGTLREKIARFLSESFAENNNINLSMTREEMADYLGVARPSLSRELMKMKEDGIIEIKGKSVKVLNEKALLEYL